MTMTDPIHSFVLRQAARTIDNGGVIAYPTEAVYGLGCDPLDAGAVLRILSLKQRAADKGVILIAAELSQLLPYLLPLSPALRRKVSSTWPGPVTWVLPARPETPWWLRGAHDTLAVRVTAHPIAAALCRASAGALVSTSANRAGRPPARTALRVRRVFSDQIDLIVHGALGDRARPTEIRDARSGRVLRAGG